MKPCDSRELEALLPRLWDVGAEAWERYRLGKDPMHGRMVAGEMTVLAKSAGARAAAALADLHQAHGRLPPAAHAERLGLIVADSPRAKGDAPPFLSLAERDEKRISVSPDALATIDRVIDAHGLGDRAGDRTLRRDMLIAHELYHHLEWFEPERYQPSERVVVWRLGPLKWRAVPAALSEIAAMTFSHLATGERYQPDILELLFLAGRDPAAAVEWLRAVVNDAGGSHPADAM